MLRMNLLGLSLQGNHKAFFFLGGGQTPFLIFRRSTSKKVLHALQRAGDGAPLRILARGNFSDSWVDWVDLAWFRKSARDAAGSTGAKWLGPKASPSFAGWA